MCLREIPYIPLRYPPWHGDIPTNWVGTNCILPPSLNLSPGIFLQPINRLGEDLAKSESTMGAILALSPHFQRMSYLWE